MKKIQASLLAASIAFGASAASAGDNLAEAIKGGKFYGDVWFLHTQGNDVDIKAVGRNHDNAYTASITLTLNYDTADYKGFSLHTELQHAYDFRIHEYDGYESEHEDESRNTINGTNMSQMYLKYRIPNTKSTIDIGRKVIFTPLIWNDGHQFPNSDSYDGIDVMIKDIPKTALRLMAFNKWNSRLKHSPSKPSNFDIAETDVDYDDGLFSVWFKNKSIKNVTLFGQYLLSNTDVPNIDFPNFNKSGKYDVWWLRGMYKLPTSHPMTAGLTLTGANWDVANKVGADDSSAVSLLLKTKIGKLPIVFSYTTVDDDRDLPGTLGHAVDVSQFSNTMPVKAHFAGSETFRIRVMPNFGIKNFKSKIGLIYIDQSEDGMAASDRQYGELYAADIDLRYRFTKNFHMRSRTQFAFYDEDRLSPGGDEDTSIYTRFYLMYDF